MERRITRKRIRAPQRHGEIFADPPLPEASREMAENIAALNGCSAVIGGLSLAELRSTARKELLSLAWLYSSSYRDLDPRLKNRSAPLVLSGHQPELFHAGVWVKNFALARVAEATSGSALHLVMDNDVGGGQLAVRTPTLENGRPAVVPVAIDAAGPVLPWEERPVRDIELWNSFSARVTEKLSPLLKYPLIGSLWPRAVAAAQQGALAGEAIAQARHWYEGQIGLQTLEIPLSRVCDTESFLRFALHIMLAAPQLMNVYNDALEEYRLAHRIRSRSHPVPKLAEQQEWIESPLWHWTTCDPHRRHVFVKKSGKNLEISNLAGERVRLEKIEDRPEVGVEQLLALASRGWKLRPRALTATMYARLVLGDYFLHGIGGAKYDQLTDAIISRFFEVTPPAFATITATVQLPISRPDTTAADLRTTQSRLRELEYHPELHLANGEGTRWIEQKQTWIEHNENSFRRHEAIAEANQHLRPLVAAQRRQLEKEYDEQQEDLRIAELLGSREFSFCLFPAEFLIPLIR